MKKLAFALARSRWAIDHVSGLNMFPSVHGLLTGNPNAFSTQIQGLNVDEDGNIIQEPVAFIVGKDGQLLSLSDVLDGNADVAKGSIGIMNVSGVMMKDSFCGMTGTMEMAEQVKALSAIEEINTILFDTDSPGGQVDGTETFADAIRESGKRTIGLVNNGMACSAGYWPISGCDELYATHATCEIGSIGVYATLSDYSKYYEEMNIKIEDVYADQSTEKNKGYIDWKAGDPKVFKERLTLVATEFISAVETNRAGKLNLSVGDPFKGAVYGATKATEIGLIDGIKKKDALINELLNEKLTLKFN